MYLSCTGVCARPAGGQMGMSADGSCLQALLGDVANARSQKQVWTLMSYFDTVNNVFN